MRGFEMKTYFTLGQSHLHKFGKHVLTKDVVIVIDCDDPRAKMFELFGDKWAFEYSEQPEMHYYRRGLFDPIKGEFVGRETE